MWCVLLSGGTPQHGIGHGGNIYTRKTGRPGADLSFYSASTHKTMGKEMLVLQAYRKHYENLGVWFCGRDCACHTQDLVWSQHWQTQGLWKAHKKMNESSWLHLEINAQVSNDVVNATDEWKPGQIQTRMSHKYKRKLVAPHTQQIKLYVPQMLTRVVFIGMWL